MCTPNAASASARASAGLATGPFHAQTHFCWLSQVEGWRNLSWEKHVGQLLQPFSFASWPAGKHREAAIAPISPEDACATATSPSTSRETQDFKNTQRLCPPPQLVSTICAAHPGSKKQIWAQVRRQKKISLMQWTTVKIQTPQNYFAHSSGVSPE